MAQRVRNHREIKLLRQAAEILFHSGLITEKEMNRRFAEMDQFKRNKSRDNKIKDPKKRGRKLLEQMTFPEKCGNIRCNNLKPKSRKYCSAQCAPLGHYFTDPKYDE